MSEMSTNDTGSEAVDIALLAVHGIGNQRQMATVAEVGGALVGSMRGWLAPATVTESRHQGSETVPAHARVAIDRVDDEPLSALVAEGWWADAVPAPGTWTLLKWLVLVVPFVVPRVLDAGLRRSSYRMDETPWWHPVFLASAAIRLGQNVFVVGVTLALLCVLFALWALALPRAAFDGLRGPRPPKERRALWLPIAAGIAIGTLLVALVPGPTAPKLALVAPAALAGVLFVTLPRLVNTVLASFIGDCYALLRRPEIERAMVKRVEDALAWLEGQVGDAPIVIVAHSQGAEIVRRVLAERTRPVRGLVTYGSGIAKLKAVGHLRDAPWRAMGAFALRVLSAALVVLGAVLALSDGGSASSLLVAVGLLAAAAASLTAARAVLQHIFAKESQDVLGIGPERVGRWVDFYTANDPVSEGELPIEEPWGRSSEIVNWRVLLVDHIAYWHNVQAFRAAVALELADMIGRGRGDEVRSGVEAAAAERARGVARGVAIRWALLAGVVAAFALGAGAVRFALAGAVIAAGAAAEVLLFVRARERARRWSPCTTAPRRVAH